MNTATKFEGKTCLLVGASSGIGRALALKLASMGVNLALVARRESKLIELREEICKTGSECLILVGDAANEEESAGIVEQVRSHFGRIDIAILNAGGAPAIDMRKMSASEVNFYMRSNYDVTVNIMFPVLEVMKEQSEGLIVHTNSLAGFLGIPLQGPYSAAKAATRILIDTCRLEFSEFGIHFCTVYPGFVATEATRDDGMPAPLEISEEEAADHILHAMAKGKGDYMFPWHMRWLIRIAHLLPNFIVRTILKNDVPALEG